MFRLLLTTFLGFIFFLAQAGCSQTTPDSIYHERLFYLCKVWGHAKYYHTEIAAGNVEWEEELFKAISGAKNAPTDEAFNDTLLLMLNNAGEMGISNDPLPVFPDSLNNNLNYSWIQDPIFNDEVRTFLDTIRVRFRPQQNAYLNQAVAGNPVFDNDKKYYSTGRFPDEEIRLLGLFRFWNIIHYFFPYKYMMDQDWDITLKEFIPQISKAQDALEFHLALKELTTRINDTHGFASSTVYREWRGEYYPPFLTRTIDNNVVITKVMPDVDAIKKGDIIRKIDGIDISYAKDSVRKYAHGSNDVMIDYYANQLLMWGEFGDFELTVEDGNNSNTVTLARNDMNFNELHNGNYSHPAWRDTLLHDSCKFGIVDMAVLEPEDVEQMFQELWNAEIIIFDVRNYPLGTLWTIVNYIYENPLHIASFTYPDTTFPGRLKWHYETIGNGTSDPYAGNIIILFDERTISQAEYTCMGLDQFPDAIKIGSTTAAADGNVSSIYVTANFYAGMTGLGTFYPDFTETQRVGIIPDYEMRPTITGIREGRDELMEFAMNCDLFGVQEEDKEQQFDFYPNPVSSTVHYIIHNNDQQKKITFHIIDMLGRIIFSQERYSNKGLIDLSNIDSGIYLVRIIIEEKTNSKKIVIL